MIRFHCACGAEIFFENTCCTACGRSLGFDPQSQRLLTLQATDGDFCIAEPSAQPYKRCAQRRHLSCNWLIETADGHPQCLSCRSTRTIPTLSLQRNLSRWQRLEQTKRRALYMVLRLGLPLYCSHPGAHADDAVSALPYPLIFDFLEDRRSNPDVAAEFVYSGHRDGVITLNAAEADDSYRTAAREQMHEAYRTLLGHFRHELGHYYWFLLPGHAETLHTFRQLFGDERDDYTAALEYYYKYGARGEWREKHISAYASAHPLEDWAETWAHYLHMRDTLETALAFETIGGDAGDTTFEYWMAEWMKLSVILNALNRSMGVDDAYPFVITAEVKRKLEFIDRLVRAWRMPGHIAATR